MYLWSLSCQSNSESSSSGVTILQTLHALRARRLAERSSSRRRRTAHGALALDANGGFSYTPAAGFSGADSFTYMANDTKDDSNVATVTLTISATAAPQTDVIAFGDQGTAQTTVTTSRFSTTSATSCCWPSFPSMARHPAGGRTPSRA